jgi:hypothetical protein
MPSMVWKLHKVAKSRGMKIAHLILAHNKPQQLARLIEKLEDADSYIFIHLDKKIDMAPFEYLKEMPRVFFIANRVKIIWGAYNMVEATINSFKEIANAGIDFGFVNLLSGQDYPIKPIKAFINYLDEHPNGIFMSYLGFETEWQEAMARINQYHFTNYNIKGKYIAQRIINKISPSRVFPNSLIPVGRSQWFTIPLVCVQYILDYWSGNKELQKFIKLTWAPDEFIFQTILYNSIFRPNMVNHNLRFMIWEPEGKSPLLLTSSNFEQVINSEKYFARKFDADIDENILNLIDHHLADNI